MFNDGYEIRDMYNLHILQWITPVSDFSLIIKWFIRTYVIKLPKLFWNRILTPAVVKWILVKVLPSTDSGSIARPGRKRHVQVHHLIGMITW